MCLRLTNHRTLLSSLLHYLQRFYFIGDMPGTGRGRGKPCTGNIQRVFRCNDPWPSTSTLSEQSLLLNVCKSACGQKSEPTGDHRWRCRRWFAWRRGYRQQKHDDAHMTTLHHQRVRLIFQWPDAGVRGLIIKTVHIAVDHSLFVVRQKHRPLVSLCTHASLPSHLRRNSTTARS